VKLFIKCTIQHHYATLDGGNNIDGKNNNGTGSFKMLNPLRKKYDDGANVTNKKEE
jgi:hypothetical protein